MSAQHTPEPARPDILERLSYHALERHDLTLEECLAVLAHGWKTVVGRPERQLVFQITALLAGQPTVNEKLLESLERLHEAGCDVTLANNLTEAKNAVRALNTELQRSRVALVEAKAAEGAA